MSNGLEKNSNTFVSVTGGDDFNAQDIKVAVDGTAVFVKALLAKGPNGKDELVSYIRKIITRLNDGYDFGKELAEEWVNYLLLLLNGCGKNLINPYSDLVNYQIEAFSENTENLNSIDAMAILDKMPTEALKKTNRDDMGIMNKTLYITALGGTDSSFYNGLSKEEIKNFAKEIYAPELVASFEKYDVVDLIPRGFASKKGKNGNYVTNVESTILQAYNAGVKHVAVIGNARTKQAISDYLDNKLGCLNDLKVIVTAQPLLPIIRASHRTKELLISVENGGYQGGHGHGFKQCLRDREIQQNIEEYNLKFFIFGNGDNAVMLNWGADPFASTIRILQGLRRRPEFENLGIAFFLVWEYLRKGGFTFLLTHKKTGNRIVQIIEAELAEKSGADIKNLETNRGGYNTNVAAGIIEKAMEHCANLPMALKRKNAGKYTNFLFEASLGTAMTTHQNSDGSSVFANDTAISILGPKVARFQHWNHISIRKRDDLFAYFSSLFKIKKIRTDFGELPLIFTERDASQNHPILKGNFINPAVLNTKEFFEVFKDADMDVNAFRGIIRIDLLEERDKPRGSVKFEGNIKLIGDGEVSITVPAGELWIVRDKIIDTRDGYSVFWTPW